MHPFFEIFGIRLGTWGLMVLIGAGAASAAAFALGKRRGTDAGTDFGYAVLYGIAFAVIGAITLKPAVNIAYVAANWAAFAERPAGRVLEYIFGEIVFYGGLLGGLLGMFLYCRRYRVPLLPHLDRAAPCVALAQAFGRIGCLLGGCCYGMTVSPEHPLAVIYPPYPIERLVPYVAPAGVPLLPVPVLESAFSLILFTALSVVYVRTRTRGVTAAAYMMGYGLWRFVIEYFRGDIIRGKYGIFTTSQYLSVALVAAGVLLLAVFVRRERENRRVRDA